MDSNFNLPNLRYDFSSLSKGRLRAYNRMLGELSKETEGIREINEEELDLLAAAGNIETVCNDLPVE